MSSDPAGLVFDHQIRLKRNEFIPPAVPMRPMRSPILTSSKDPPGSGQIFRIVQDWLLKQLVDRYVHGGDFGAKEVSDFSKLSEKAVQRHLAKYSRGGKIRYIGHRNRRPYFILS